MGTEVLHPQDILTLRLRSIPTISSRPRQQQQPSYTSPRSCRKQAVKPEPRRRRSPNPDANTPKNVAMGQVTILKRGESLDSKKSHEFRRNDLKKSVSMTESDLIICSTQRLGPDHPELVPKQISVLSPAFVRSEGVYAGSAFSQSPSPSSLPLPKFPSKKKEGVAGSVCVDDSATKDLRRLLRLE